MWLLLLSLLAFEGIQSASVGYPYHSVWTYSPVKSGSVPGYLRYLENGGVGALVGYNNPHSAYAIRQIKYVSSATPAVGTYPINNSEEIIKTREAYLRAASLQQYQNLKRDIDALKSEGKEPSAEKLLKLEMLQKIAFTSDFSLITDLPEIRSTLQDLEAGISGLYKESAEQTLNEQKNFAHSQGEIKTYVGNSDVPLVAIEETPEQKEARENHLRIYNEQIAHLKKLESEHQKYIEEVSSKSNIPHSKNTEKSTFKQGDDANALKELERAKQEHFRLWNEAKLNAEQSGYKSEGVYETADKQQISALTSQQNIIKSKQTSLNNQNLETLKPQAAVADRKQVVEQSLKNAISNLKQTHQVNDLAKLKTHKAQIGYQTPQLQHVVDTPEVANAREEHLRIVNEAILQAQTDQTQLQKQNIKSEIKAENLKESLSQQIPSTHLQYLKGTTSTNYRLEVPLVEETPEVKRAREEHLRLVHEANLRAQYVEQQALKYKHESQTPILKSQFEHQQQVYHPETSKNIQETSEVAKAFVYKGEQDKKSIVFPSQEQSQQPSEGQSIGDTDEVQRARHEHLRIFNSIKSHAEQERSKQNSRNFPHTTSQQNPTLDYSTEEERLLELERLREAERLQKEQQLLEFDRLREAERLAEEKRQMEAELIRLRLEEEQRLEMERFLEEKRLRQEQEELQKLKNDEYQEIIIANDPVDSQSQISFISSSNSEQARTQQNSKFVEQQSQQFVNNPFLKIGQVATGSINNQQSSFLKTVPAHATSNIHQHTAVTSNTDVTSNDNTLTGVRYIQSPHQSSGSKYQHIKDDNVKSNYHSAASSQPADTAVALIALEKATNDHFRAHELALEQLRIAKIQNPSIKDCN